MEWSSATVANLKKCFQNREYRAWSEAVESAQLEEFPEGLDDLVDRLSGILLTELECRPAVHEKIVKFMELAALAGKVL